MKAVKAILNKLACLQKLFSRTSTIHPGIFHRRALWAVPRINTIASRDQFKEMKIGENLVVNYDGW